MPLFISTEGREEMKLLSAGKCTTKKEDITSKVTSVIIGIIESVQARLRMVHVQQYILFAAGLAVILLISVIFVRI